MERYYVPAQFTLSDNESFAVLWVGSNYRVFSDCVDRSTGNTVNYIEVSPWGFTVDVGTTNLSSNSKLLVGNNCDPSEYDISTVAISRSLLDTPELTPYEPIYFLGFLALGIFIFSFCLRLLFGRVYK